MIAGNKCPVALASLPAAAAACRIWWWWFDAHGDLNTPANSATGDGGVVWPPPVGNDEAATARAWTPPTWCWWARDLDPAEAGCGEARSDGVHGRGSRTRPAAAFRGEAAGVPESGRGPGVPSITGCAGGLTPTGLRACLAALAGSSWWAEVTEFRRRRRALSRGGWLRTGRRLGGHRTAATVIPWAFSNRCYTAGPSLPPQPSAGVAVGGLQRTTMRSAAR